MADSDIEIRATLDAQDAKREAEELGRSGADAAEAMESAAQGASGGLDEAAESAGGAAESVSEVGDAAQDAAEAAEGLGDAMSDSLRRAGDEAGELSRRLDGVAESVGRINARQLVGMAGNLAGMGFDVWDVMHPGQSSRSTVAGGAIQGGFSGASMLAGLGPWGMLAGALGGAALGAFTNQKRQENAEAEEARATEEAVRAGGEYVRTMMDQIAHTRELDEFMRRLGDTSESVAERQAAAAARIAELGARQKELEWAMGTAGVRGDPAQLRQVAAEYQRNAAEIDRIRHTEIREERARTDTAREIREKTESFARRTQIETDSLARLGINAGGGADSRVVESIDRQVGEIKGTLDSILAKTGDTGATWQ